VIFNIPGQILGKIEGTQMKLSDKFLGNSQTQYIYNKVESKIIFASDTFAHEIQYSITGNQPEFKFNS
jgi:hypothetical protein